MTLNTPLVQKHNESESVLRAAIARQSVASNPNHHVWVSASAGTGKTKVLTDRVLRLLLPSKGRKATPPEKIVCITFTKAAAAEMETRIQEVLAGWSEWDDEKLKSYLESLLGEEVTPDIMQEARRLFARIVDTSGGMKIQNLHSFCQSVLKRFPLEAGLNPGFEVIDDRSAREILQFVVDTVFYATSKTEKNSFTDAIDYLAKVLNEDQFNDLVKTLVSERQQFYKLFKNHTMDDVVDKIYERLDLEKDKPRSSYVHEFVKGLDWEKIRQFIVALDSGSPTEQKKVPNLQNAVENKGNEEIVYNALCEFLFKSGGEELYQNPINKKNVEKQPADVGLYLEELKETICETKEKLKSLALAESSKAFMTVADIIIRLYQEEKKRNNYLDYDDLIDYTVALLSEQDQSAWVLYKLDGGIDHILVDEAQDTSPEQWKVIESLTAEFFSGEGKETETPRTLFVVGDEKQSIYSFQKADPYEFIRMRNFFEEKIAQSKQIFKSVQLQVSFRSTHSVLSFVDGVFSDFRTAKGVSFDESQMQHLVHREGQAGHVEIWPVAFIPNEKEETESWPLPLEPKKNKDANAVLADKIASTIKHWLDNKEILESQDRPIVPSDIMILLRERGRLMQELVSALKAYDIPIAGVDRLDLKEQLCVQDLLSAASFVLLPHDDLNLACFLKSPLLGCDDNDLMEIAIGRGQSSLWEALRHKEKFIAQYDYLKELLFTHAHKRPFEFFSFLLSAKVPYADMNGKKAMLSRLGGEILDPLDELLNLALHYEQNHTHTLQSFMDWLGQDDFEIKRDTSKNQGTVAIMTVHGSKGLQAPIVFMADATKLPEGKKLNKNLIWHENIPFWAPKKEFKSKAFTDIEDDIKEKTREEYRRLLYVGLTRAEDRLYICGAKKAEKEKEDTWYSYVESAIKARPDIQEKPWPDTSENWSGDKIYFIHQEQKVPAKKKHTEEQAWQDEALPQWIASIVVQKEEISRPLKPSKPDEDFLPVVSPLEEVEEGEIRFSRGLLIHSLLEFLPGLPKDKREQASKAYIKKQKPTWREEKVEALCHEVLGVLHSHDFADVFGPHSKAEVSISGLVESTKQGKSFVLSGKIDRLVVREKDVLIVDFKTNRPAAHKVEDIPPAYLKQMSLYRDVLARVYPQKDIKAALLWTDISKLMILPSGLLDDHRP